MPRVDDAAQPRSRAPCARSRVPWAVTTALLVTAVLAATDAPASAAPDLGGAGAAVAPDARAAVTPAVRSAAARGSADVDLAERGWEWPVDAFRFARPYAAPAHRYGTGHRGIDLRPSGEAIVHAPAAGIVAFSGEVAGRGILTIDHGDGLVTTFEPVDSTLTPGTPVDRREEVATLALGGHAGPGALHFGVRLHGEYINPMLLLGGLPRAILLPCC
ncbi:MAG: M23 family metallopeptidase [Microbacterium sp.]